MKHSFFFPHYQQLLRFTFKFPQNFGFAILNEKYRILIIKKKPKTLVLFFDKLCLLY